MSDSFKALAATAATVLSIGNSPLAWSQTLITQLMPPAVFAPVPPSARGKAIPSPIMPKRTVADETAVEARIVLGLALAAEQDGKTAQALDLYSQVIDIAKRSDSPSMDMAVAAGRLGALYADVRELTSAIKYADLSLQEFEKVEGPLNSDIGIELNNIGWIREQRGEKKLAEAAYKRALVVLLACPDENDDLIGITENNYGDFLTSERRVKESIAHYGAAHLRMSSFFGADHPLSRMTLNKLHHAQRDLRRRVARLK